MQTMNDQVVGLIFGQKPTATRAEWAKLPEFTPAMAIGDRAQWFDFAIIERTKKGFVFMGLENE